MKPHALGTTKPAHWLQIKANASRLEQSSVIPPAVSARRLLEATS